MKAVVVPMSKVFIGDFCKSTHNEHFLMHIDGVPKDATLLDIYYSNENRQFMVCFTHESFLDVAEGIPFPIFKVRVTVQRKSNVKDD